MSRQAREPSDAERAQFLKRFEHFGSEPSAERYLALFHPEATLFDDGMEHPIGVAEIPAHIEGVLALVKGFRMQPERWRARGRHVMVEAYNHGEVAGHAVSWRAVYRIELEGSRVRDGRRYFDRAALLAVVDPATPSVTPRLAPDAPETRAPAGAVPGCALAPADFVNACADAWREGRPETLASLYREDGSIVLPGLAALGGPSLGAAYRKLALLLGGARLTPRAWTGDDALLFIEWEGDLAGGARFGAIERFDRTGGLALASRWYFETGALARALG
jgi:hypothetical protein